VPATAKTVLKAPSIRIRQGPTIATR
jgi:hypothetical protein